MRVTMTKGFDPLRKDLEHWRQEYWALLDRFSALGPAYDAAVASNRQLKARLDALNSERQSKIYRQRGEIKRLHKRLAELQLEQAMAKQRETKPEDV